MLESQNTTYGAPAVARFCKPQRERAAASAAAPWLRDCLPTEAAPLPQRREGHGVQPLEYQSKL